MLPVCVSSSIVEEIKRIIKTSEIIKWGCDQGDSYMYPCWQFLREDDSKWPQKNKDGRQELEIRLGNDHISFEVGTTRPVPTYAFPYWSMWPDRQDRIISRRDRVRRSRRLTSFLLSGSRSESTCLQSNSTSFQNQAYISPNKYTKGIRQGISRWKRDILLHGEKSLGGPTWLS